MGERLFETKTEAYFREGISAGLRTTGAIFAPISQAEKPLFEYLAEKAKRKLVVSAADRFRKAGVTYRRVNRARLGLA